MVLQLDRVEPELKEEKHGRVDDLKTTRYVERAPSDGQDFVRGSTMYLDDSLIFAGRSFAGRLTDCPLVQRGK